MVEDPNLSLKAKGFITYCLSKEETWTFYIKQLVTVLKEGQRALYGIIDECIREGYALRYQPRDVKGNFLEWETIISDSKEEILELKKELLKDPYLKKFVPHCCFAQAEKSEAAHIYSNTDPTYTKQQHNSMRVEPSSSSTVPITVVVSKEKEKKKEPDKPPKYQPKPWQNKETKIHQCLKELPIPLEDKIKITRRFNEECVRNAIEWATSEDLDIHTTLVQTVWYGCNKGLKRGQKRIPIKEEVCKHFINYEIYNHATCYIEQNSIAFERGMNHKQLKFEENDFWGKFMKMCSEFGINFSRGNNGKDMHHDAD